MSVFDSIDLVDEKGRYCVPDPELVSLGEQIIDCYKLLRPSYTPGRVSIPKKAYVKFYQAAKLCRRRRQTAEEFVKGQLDGMAQEGNFWPTAIACEKYGQTASDHNMSYVKKVRHYKSQLDLFNRCSSIYGARSTIADRVAQFSPLFRYYVAMKSGFEDIAEEYRDAAALEYRANPSARDVFGDIGSFNGT